MRINNNVTALNAHRQYGINNANISKSVEKLSSGYRINRAGDDAAGLAISEKMRAQIRGLTMASKNSQDAISLVQTAEGALQESHNILQRMRELAVQSASDTNETSIDRNALQQEFAQLIKELDDTAGKTKFNDQGLIDGSFAKQITTASGTTAHGLVWADSHVTAGTYAITVAARTVVEAFTGTAGTATEVDAVNASATNGTITASWATATATETDSTLNGIWTFSVAEVDGIMKAIATNSSNGKTIDRVLSAGDQTIDFGDLGTITLSVTGNVTAADFKSLTGSIRMAGAADPTEAEYQFVAKMGSDELVLQTGQETLNFSNTGISVQLKDAIAVNTKTSDTTLVSSVAGNVTVVKSEGKSLVIQTGANQGDSLSINLGNMDAYSLGLAAAGIANRANAQVAITQVNTAINVVSTQRAALGALQNRLDHKIANLDTSAENLTAAESRIRDVDMAKQMTEFTKQNILAQASTAMLAQANALPQGVLQLLG